MIFGLNWKDITSDIIVLMVGVLIWLWKRATYGRMDKFEKKQDEMKKELEMGIETAKITAKNAVEYAEHQAEREAREIRHTVEREIELIKQGFVPISLCSAERDGCQGKLMATIEAGFDAQAARSEAQAGRSADIMERLNLLIQRFDKHLERGE